MKIHLIKASDTEQVEAVAIDMEVIGDQMEQLMEEIDAEFYTETLELTDLAYAQLVAICIQNKAS